MHLARYRMGRRTGYGIVDGGWVYQAEGPWLPNPRRGRRVARVEEVRLLAPARPSKIVAVGKNYLDHAQEMGGAAPPEPLLFLKAPSALIGPGDSIVVPRGAGRIDYEGELVVVVGRRARGLSQSEALEAVLGFTCGLDVTARELQRQDRQWARAKSFDTFAPLGPVIETGCRWEGRRLRTRLNGRVVQDALTDQMLFSVPRLVSFITRVMTLLPGDLIFTGTPSGIGALSPGDVLEVEIEGIGTLCNPVAAED